MIERFIKHRNLGVVIAGYQAKSRGPPEGAFILEELFCFGEDNVRLGFM